MSQQRKFVVLSQNMSPKYIHGESSGLRRRQESPPVPAHACKERMKCLSLL